LSRKGLRLQKKGGGGFPPAAIKIRQI